MLSSLNLRAFQVLGSICTSKLDSSLVPKDAAYAEFSSELVKELEGVIKKVDSALEEECRYLLFLAVTHVISHLLLHDPYFEFAWLMDPVPKESHGDLETAMGGHVRMLLEKLSCDDDEESEKDPPTMP
ncbi:hypothetical protein D1007_57961 [Hordeum vulgare]|nr:hypothetical protein D1007_57961 [Hordeum vulgare]